jgi:hypothetical protein
MGWLQREWRAFVAKMGRRVGPQRRPLGELLAYAFALFLAMIWIMARWDYVMNF